MQELCRLLGSRLFEECQKNCGASLEMREEKTRTDNKVRKPADCVLVLFRASSRFRVYFMLTMCCVSVHLNARSSAEVQTSVLEWSQSTAQ